MVGVFTRDGYDYFTDMMPALHNYITVDTKAFLSNPMYMEAMYNMAKAMLEVHNEGNFFSASTLRPINKIIIMKNLSHECLHNIMCNN